MRFEHEATIDAPAAVVWGVYSDVERWPEWTDSVKEVRYVQGDSIALGARARVTQPKLPKAEWEVSLVESGRSWTWTAKAPGMSSVAVHEVIPEGDTQTRVRAAIDMRGPLGAIFGRL